MRQRLMLAGVLGGLAGVVLATGASAAPLPGPNNAYWAGNRLYYAAGYGKTNNLVVTTVGAYVTTFDDTTSIVPGEGCSRPSAADPTVVICVEPTGLSGNKFLSIGLNDLNDSLEIRGQLYYNEITGGSGNDTIRLLANSGYYNIVYGNAGNDVLERAESVGFDRLLGGTGADTMCSPGGVVSYEDHPTAVVADIGGAAGNDGSPGEGDTICGSIRALFGSPFNDVLRAGVALKVGLYGRAGTDQLFGSTGNDILWGDDGADTLSAGAGADHLTGGTGADSLNGGADADECRIGPSDVSIISCDTTVSDSDD